MKKHISIILVIILVFSLSACRTITQTPPGTTRGTATAPGTQPATTPGTTGVVSYKDGTYDGAGDPWQYGKENATVIINNGKISTITLRRLDTNGVEVNYNDWTGKEVNGQKRPNLKEYREDMAKKMVQAQTYNVDTISGATETTRNWKVSVQRALDKARK